MAQLVAPQPRPATRSAGLAIVVSLALLVAILPFLDPGRVAWMQTLLIVFGSLLVQALPFVLLGALASSLIEVFVPVGTLERIAKLPRPLQLPVAALAGVAFPICECGSVPVARRLVSRGLSASAAVTFMLAAPVLNPVVVASTFFAYRGRSTMWTMVLGRFGLGFLVAIAVGWVIGSRSRDELVRPRAGEWHAHAVAFGPPERRWRRFFVHLGNDFLFMGRFLMLGAVAAAAVQTFLPASVLSTVAGAPIVGLVAMMALAAGLSLCSESDAFVAASFVQFGPASQLAFLVFGPMVDLKLVALYSGTFRRGFVRTVVIAVAATTLVGALWIQVLIG